ncbi:MAG: hypothetical protein ABSF90_17090 [Syntrophobacteraceae bacterium]
MPIVSRKRKEKEKTKDGNQYAQFVDAVERIGPYDESVLDEALKKIGRVKPAKAKRDKKGNGEAPHV